MISLPNKSRRRQIDVFFWHFVVSNYFSLERQLNMRGSG
ncbi:hypothetical protein L843_4844 [Mycobacterium intracellulare MIN_061107_1834]|nr:hypothetical protein L843_4844 [Mycobacterium intracellulare MIN_061107_1834]